MREVGTDRAGGLVPRTAWQAPQPAARNRSRPRCWPRRRRLGGGAASRCEPGVELGRRHGHDLKRHQRVRAAAIFGALAAIDARPIGRQAQTRGAARDHVDLAAEARHPEASGSHRRDCSVNSTRRPTGMRISLALAIRSAVRRRIVTRHHHCSPVTSMRNGIALIGRDQLRAHQPDAVAEQDRQRDRRKDDADRDHGMLARAARACAPAADRRATTAATTMQSTTVPSRTGSRSSVAIWPACVPCAATAPTAVVPQPRKQQRCNSRRSAGRRRVMGCARRGCSDRRNRPRPSSICASLRRRAIGAMIVVGPAVDASTPLFQRRSRSPCRRRSARRGADSLRAPSRRGSWRRPGLFGGYGSPSLGQLRGRARSPPRRSGCDRLAARRQRSRNRPRACSHVLPAAGRRRPAA